MKSALVDIQEGRLQGDFGINYNGQQFYRFRGIPYAKPPVDKLRFQPPQPAEPWNGTLDATKCGSPSLQKEDSSGNIIGSEDCLHLNVYTREVYNTKPQLKPVMVFLHGGAYITGSNDSSFLGPEFLMMEDIVLVCVNYRLGMLGFLSLQDSSLKIPGNNGLKDQTLALKWVQNNISKFGGDPYNVTLFGESAGASAVSFHISSPYSKGLFHKAIMQSSCALNNWTYGTHHTARYILKHIGKQASNEKEALECLMNLPCRTLFQAQIEIYDSVLPRYKRAFAPVIETPNENAFITRNVKEILISGEYNKVPMIYGYNNREGIYIEYIRRRIKQPVVMEEGIPRELNVNQDVRIEQEITEQINKIYNGPDELENEYLLFTDTLFLIRMMECLRLYLKSENMPIYFYRMSLESRLNFFKLFVTKAKSKGVAHVDDIGHLFKTMFTPPEIKPNSLEDISIKRFVKLWTNFAKTGNPTPTNDLNMIWYPVTSKDNPEFLDIREELVMDLSPDEERVIFWKKLYAKYCKHDYLYY